MEKSRIKARSRSWLAKQYGVCLETIRRRLTQLEQKENISIPARQLLSPKILRVYYNEFGQP